MTSSPSQQYCLRWNNYQNNLTNVFDQLLQSEAFVDVTLACEGHSLKAHKVVLSACSPYFQSLFFDNPCKHPIVILNGIKWDELKSVVEFMYRGEINVSQDQLAPLLKVAEVLKIRGLADVSRVGPSNVTNASSSGGGAGGSGSSRNNATDLLNNSNNSKSSSHQRNNASNNEFINTSLHDSGSESPSSNNHLLSHHHHHHHLSSNGSNSNNNPLHPLLQQGAGPSGSSGSPPVALSAQQAHQMLASLSRRKRRKMSTPERTPSPTDEMDDHSNQLEIDSTNGDYGDRSSPGSNLIPESPSNLLAGSVSMSLTSTSTGGNHNNGNSGGSNANPNSNSLASAAAAAASLGPIGPALLNLHAAAAAAAAVAANSGGNGGSSVGGGGNHHPSSSGMGGGGSSSVSNDLDIKPGIVEMIREEERAKMLESAHGWLGPSSSTLSESYQYQIQNLWQKCWNQNQTGMMHALRFRERGPLKSWRPETMAEAIFAVLREGLSLSQAARKYDIPYPTFVLYANRVHNMLGPSADGSSNTDLMSDMRPKGRGRPQRILLGTWPEEHIRGVIRAVVFRDTQTKDDIPAFVFNRDGGLCLSSAQSGGNNGLDMSLHQQFLGGANSPSPFLGTPPPPSSSAGGQSSSSQGGNSTAPSPLPSSSSLGPSSSSGLLADHTPSSSDRLSGGGGAHQHLQIQMREGNSASSSASSSPLQQALNNSTALSGIGAQAQSQLLALQQRHLQQQLQLHHQQQQRRTSSESPSIHHHGSSSSSSKYNGGRSSSSSYFHRSSSRSSLLSKEIEKELLARSQIKTELITSPYDEDNEDEEEDLEESGVGGGLPRPGGISSGLTRGISEEEAEDVEEEDREIPVESSSVLGGIGEQQEVEGEEVAKPLKKTSKDGSDKSLNNNNDLKQMDIDENDDEEEDAACSGSVAIVEKSPSSHQPLDESTPGELNDEGGVDLIPTVSNNSSPSPRSLLETKTSS